MNTESTAEVVVRRSVRVPLDPARAFALFTDRMQDYWPKDHSIGGSPRAAIVLEPRAGGRWFERGEDGSECAWGRVGEWTPPGRLVLIWQLSAEWTYDPDLTTPVEIDFVAEAPGRTRVDLAHRHLERYGARAEAMRAAFEGPGAWQSILDSYAGEASRRTDR